MDQFTRDDLKRLVESSGEPAVSIYMPTHRAGRDVRENATRFKNLLKLAYERVGDRFSDNQTLRARLKEAAKLENDDAWWQHQSDGLAMFFSGDHDDRYRVPLKFEEFVAAARRFQVLPLVRLLQGDGRYYILAVSQNRVRLLEGTHYAVEELDPQQLPSNLRSALNIDEYTSSLQQHSTGGPDAAGTMTFHGHGAADMDVQKKDEIQQFFQRIDAALGSYFGSERTPLVFAGVDYLFPIFRDACDYDGLVERSVAGNPDDLTAEQLHQEAWEVVQPLFAQHQNAALERYKMETGGDKALADLPDILRAARQGAIDTLFVAENQRQWCVVDEQSGEVRTAGENADGAEELLNYGAVGTLASGGTVYCLPSERMPDRKHAAALLRFPLPSP
ncbi:MAG: hypothetical protein R3E01_01985 [Pirellulaceae bacterium]